MEGSRVYSKLHICQVYSWVSFDMCAYRETITSVEIRNVSITITLDGLLLPLCNHALPPFSFHRTPSQPLTCFLPGTCTVATRTFTMLGSLISIGFQNSLHTPNGNPVFISSHSPPPPPKSQSESFYEICPRLCMIAASKSAELHSLQRDPVCGWMLTFSPS